MKTLLLSTILVLCVLWCTACADFTFVGTIPAPRPACDTDITGLSESGDNLFAVEKTRAGSYLFLLRPDDGAVLRQAEFSGCVPGCRCHKPRFSSGVTYSLEDDLYLVGDACGALLDIVFGQETSYITGNFALEGLETPTGLVFDGDTLYAVDPDDDTLIKAVGSTVVGEYGLPGIDSPSGLALYHDHLLITSKVNPGRVYEVTKQASLVETHCLAGTGLCELESIALLGNYLYVGGSHNVIYVFEGEPSGVWVPEGDDVPVEVIPGELAVGFDSVSSPGWLYVDVSDVEACPAPPGVELFPSYYELATSARFDYAASVAVTFNDSLLPAGFRLEDIRLFRRPSGSCQDFKDVTVEYAEALPVLAVLTRTKSEDDEFSVFAVGLDSRRPRAVVEFKLAEVLDAITSNEGAIPPDVFSALTMKLDRAEDAYHRGDSQRAEDLVNEIADIARGTPSIPHTFDGTPGSNVSGSIISRAHTLAFSLMHSRLEAVMTQAGIVPTDIIAGRANGWVRAYLEVPEGFIAADIDPLQIYMDASVHAVPDSVALVDYDLDGIQEVRALFPALEVGQLFEAGGPATVRLTGFVDGFEFRADAGVHVYLPTVEIMSESPLVAGKAYRITWPCVVGEDPVSYTLKFSPDGGGAWDEISAGIPVPHYDWLAPSLETTMGILRVGCIDGGVETQVFYSGEFAVVAAAGIGEVGADGIAGLVVSPNPSSGVFNLRFECRRGQPADLKIYSVKGELIRHLFQAEILGEVGTLTWRGDDDTGSPVTAGTYFAVLRRGHDSATAKLVLGK